METFEKKYRLMAPGPVPLSPAVLESLSQPMVHHRTPEFTKTLKVALELLPAYFQTQQPVLILSSTGSGAMEAAVCNTMSPGDEVLVIESGKFGKRWSELTEQYGGTTLRYEVEWGKTADPKILDELLTQNPNISVCYTQACETSTATMHPAQQLAEVCQKHDCLIVVDAITAAAATDLKMDAWGLDVVVAGSQKAFMLPTGISFIALSKKAWEAQKKSSSTKYYWDLGKELNANKKGQTFFSSNVSLITALKVVLENWQSEGGVESVVQRTNQLCSATKAGIAELGLELFSSSPSPTVTAIMVPEGVDGVQLRSHLEQEYLVTFMGGQDHLKGKIVRVGHMGYISNEDVLASIYFLAKALQDLNYDLSEEQISKALKAAKALL